MGKKILQVAAVSFTIKHLLKPLIVRLAEEGYEVHVACKITDPSDLSGLPVHKVHPIRIERKVGLSNLTAFWDLFSLMRTENFDIVHVHTPIAAVIGRMAAKAAEVPNIVYTAHGFYFHENMTKLQHFFWHSIEKVSARFFTDYLLTQSREDAEYAVRHRLVKGAPERVLHISNGVDIMNKFNPERFDEKQKYEVRKALGLTETDQVVAFIGRMVEEKGIKELLHGFAKAAEVQPNIHLWVIGDNLAEARDLDTKDWVQAFLESTPVASRIHLLGRRDDIPALLWASDIFILPSHREGMPRSIIEAMAMAKPVIATDIRGSREEVVDGETGFLIPLRDPDAIAEKILLLANHPEMIHTFGRKGRLRAEAIFDENKVLDKELQLFNRLTGGSVPG